MSIEEISVQTAGGITKYCCILKNEKEFIYEIVTINGEKNPQVITENSGKVFKIFAFDALMLKNEHVYAFSSPSSEKHIIGELIMRNPIP